MNAILGLLWILLAGLLIEIGIIIYKESQELKSYHERVNRLEQLHNETLTNTKGSERK